MTTWTKEQEQWLIDNYPMMGRKACCEYLGRSDASIRQKTSTLCLKQDKSSPFFKDWQDRAAKSKVGKKRPDQALVMRNLHAQGKLVKTDAQKTALSIRTKQWIKDKGHPRGSLGMKHTPESLKKMSNASKEMWKDRESYLRSDEYRQILSDRMSKQQAENKLRKGYSRGKQGKRADLDDRYFRSAWEANFARYLNFLIEKKQIYKWDYEVDTYWFHEIKRGTRSYTPDFKIWDTPNSEPYYIEVKGWMDQKSITKLKRMAKYYPDIRIDIVAKKEYNEIKSKLSRLIKGWE